MEHVVDQISLDICVLMCFMSLDYVWKFGWFVVCKRAGSWGRGSRLKPQQILRD